MAEILQPVEGATTTPVELDQQEPDPNSEAHPTSDTTPEEMIRARPDLTTGELKMPKMD